MSCDFFWWNSSLQCWLNQSFCSAQESLWLVYEVLVSSLGWDSLGVGLSWLLSLPSGNYQNGTILDHECFLVHTLTCYLLSSYYSVLYGLLLTAPLNKVQTIKWINISRNLGPLNKMFPLCFCLLVLCPWSMVMRQWIASYYRYMRKQLSFISMYYCSSCLEWLSKMKKSLRTVTHPAEIQTIMPVQGGT